MAKPNPKKRQRKLAIETLETRRVMATLPFGAEADDTGEFMLGRVAVTPVFLESDGSIDPSTENWTQSHIASVLNNIQTGLNWWTNLLATKSSIHTLQWVIDPLYATTPKSTPFEPISRNSNHYTQWVSRFLSDVGFSSGGGLMDNVRDFNNSQREKLDTDWSFTIFVVNSVNDGDGSFAPGGSFSRAFAFAGGLFEVVPSTRPASTFAHETGHMFWARDEYIGGSDYYQRRGYYDAQNLNAIDLNPTPNFQQELSIMSAGSNLQTAYDTLVTSEATLAQIGWKDSDGDGIFDVLDVPLELEGTGRFNSANNTYRFVGRASVQTLPNRNGSGTQNNITLNRVGRIDYRINNGSWTPVATPNQYQTDLDISIPLSVTQGQIEIRATDPRTGITSNVFRGLIGNAPDTTYRSGIQGFVWHDINRNGNWDGSETGLAGATVSLVDSNSQPLSLQRNVEPDDFPSGLFANMIPGVRLDVIGEDASGSLGIFEDPTASTGSKIFKPYSFTAGNYVEAFRGNNQQLRVRFDNPTSFVSIDAISVADDSDVRLDAFAADGTLLQRVERKGLLNGQKVTLELGTNGALIASVIARGFDGSFIKLDNLRYGPKSTAKTASDGSYFFPHLQPGTYNVKVHTEAPGYQFSNPTSSVQTVVYSAGTELSHVDFGTYRVPSPWQNPNFPEDVNNLGDADPIDVLILINEINLHQSRPLDDPGLTSPPYYDVNGDWVLSPLDILQVINFINRRGSGNGEGETRPSPNSSNDIPNVSAPFPSFAIDARARGTNTWIVSNSSTRRQREETGAEKCGCPGCSSFAPVGEYSPSIVEIAEARKPTLGPMPASEDDLEADLATPRWLELDNYLATWQD